MHSKPVSLKLIWIHMQRSVWNRDKEDSSKKLETYFGLLWVGEGYRHLEMGSACWAVSYFCLVPLTCGSIELQPKDNHTVMEDFQFHVPFILMTYTFNLALGVYICVCLYILYINIHIYFSPSVFFVPVDYWAASAGTTVWWLLLSFDKMWTDIRKI